MTQLAHVVDGCDGEVKKVFGNVGIAFKGGGYHKTTVALAVSSRILQARQVTTKPRRHRKQRFSLVRRINLRRPTQKRPATDKSCVKSLVGGSRS